MDLSSLNHCEDLPAGVADGSQVGHHGLCQIAPDAPAEATGSHPAPYLAPAFTVRFPLLYGTFVPISSLR